MTTITVARKPVNAAALEADLRAVAGAAYDGYSYNRPVAPDVYTLHFADGTPEATINAALAVYAAHDPAVLTPAQQAALDRETAAAALLTADFAALRNTISAASSLAQLKPILLELLLLQWRVAKAAGLTQTSDPGA